MTKRKLKKGRKTVNGSEFRDKMVQKVELHCISIKKRYNPLVPPILCISEYSCLVFLFFPNLFPIFLSIHGNLLIILLKRSQILTCLAEFTFFHTLTDIPMYEGTLGIHEIEFVVDTRKCFGNGGVVGNHTTCTFGLGDISIWNFIWWLGVDTGFESSWTPIDELDGTFVLDGGHGGLDIGWGNVSTVHETTRHEFSMGWITFGQKGGWFGHDRGGQLGYREGFMEGLFATHEWCVRRDEHVETWVRHENRWEVVNVDVETPVETERGGERRNDLSDQSVEVGVGRTFDVERGAADVVERLVIKIEGEVGVLEEGVCGEHSIVRLHHSGGNLRRWRDGETHLGLAAEIHGQTLEEERSETGPGTSPSGVEDEESLESRAVVAHLADLVHDVVNDVLADGVVTTCVVVGRIFLAVDDGLGVVELAVGAGADGVAHGWFEIDHDRARNVFAALRLGEEGVEGSVFYAHAGVAGHGAFLRDAVFQAVQFPAGVTDSETGLSDVERE